MSELSDLIKMLRNKKESGSDYIGIVSRVDSDTAYVQIAGSDIMDTPVRMTIDSKPGDRVRVRINGGKAWITGNDTAPPTDDTRANEAYELASKIRNNLPKDIRQVTKEMEEEGELNIGDEVDHIVIEHCLANNRVIPDGQTFADIQYTPWSTTMPTFVHGKFIWSRIVVYYKDGSVKYGDPYYDMGAQATAETVIAVRIAQDAADTAEDIAQAAAETAGEKRRVFNMTPVPPYDVNDMWFDGAHGVVYLCATAKGEDGTFSQSDWTEYSKDVSNHFWYDSSGAHVAENQGDVTTGASQTISSNGTVMMRNGKIITSWTGTQTGDAAINFYDMTSSVARNADLVASFGRGGITHYVNNIVCQALTPSGLSFYTPDSNNHPEAIFGSSGVNLYANGQLGMALTSGNMKFYDSDGSTELAEFGSSGATIGRDGDFQAKIGSGEMNFKLADGSDGFKMTMSDNYLKRDKSFSKLFTNSVSSINFEAAITATPITFSYSIGLNAPVVDKDVTDTAFPVNTTRTVGTYIQIERTGSTTFTATCILPVPSDTNGILFNWWYVEEAYAPKLNFSGSNNLLWSGTLYMSSNHTATLSESVSKQLNGIVLCWSEYSNGHARDYDWSFQFVPKDSVMRGFGNGSVNVSHFMISTNANNPHAGAKSVSVTDTTIEGDDQNARNISAGGITLNNARWVLRYVFGV